MAKLVVTGSGGGEMKVMEGAEGADYCVWGLGLDDASIPGVRVRVRGRRILDRSSSLCLR